MACERTGWAKAEGNSRLHCASVRHRPGLAEPEADEIDLLRSEEYNLLALVLGRAPGRDLLGRLVKLTGDKSELGSAHIALAQAAAVVDAEAVQREFFEL